MHDVERFDSSVKGVIYILHAGDYNVRYVGQAANNKNTNPRKRFGKHLSAARRKINRPVCDWINAHGVDNIQMYIIETFDEGTVHLMGDREMFFIEHYETYFPLGKGGVNYTLGGESNAGAVRSEEFKENLRKVRTGATHTEEAKARMSMSQSGENNPRFGTTQTEETRLKIAEGSRRSRHTRWHTNRDLIKPDCMFCTEV